MTRLVIVGGGGHGKVVAESASKLNKYAEIVFIDDEFPTLSKNSNWPVVNSLAGYLDSSIVNDDVIVAIGNNSTRELIQAQLVKHGARIVNIIDPSSVISASTQIGKGCYFAANSTVNIDSKIGDGVIINTNSSVDHDNVIEQFSHIAPGCHLAGFVSIKQGAFIGIGSSIIQGIEVGLRSVIGAGSVVIHNIPSDELAYGNPAKRREPK